MVHCVACHYYSAALNWMLPTTDDFSIEQHDVLATAIVKRLFSDDEVCKTLLLCRASRFSLLLVVVDMTWNSTNP